jgi:dolichyl-phosphate-mannose-protein mannosyltransferase
MSQKRVVISSQLLFDLLIAVSFILGVYMRVYALTTPQTLVWDETHYVGGARQYLQSKWHLHDHPPLGKLLIGVGIYFFGDNALGWRIVPTSLGLISILCVIGIVKELGGSTRTALLGGALFSLDGLLSTFSRIATLDSFILVFTIFSLYSALRARHDGRTLSVVSAGVFSGFLLAVKLNGASGIAVTALTLFVYGRYGRAVVACGICFLTAASIYYISLTSIRSGDVLHSFLQWFEYAWRYHTTPMASHRFASQWYSWFLGIKPVWILHISVSLGTVVAMISIPNLCVLLGASLLSARALSSYFSRIVRRVTEAGEWREQLIILVAIGVNIAPWLLISRPAFIYHFLPCFTLLIIYSALYLGKQRRVWSTLYLFLAFVVALYFVPIWAPYETSSSVVESRLLFRCWKDACPEY